MNARPTIYVWQHPDWPDIRPDRIRIGAALARARRAQGLVEGKLAVLDFEQRLELAAEAWSQEALATSATEGKRLDLAAVRNPVARRLRRHRNSQTGLQCWKSNGPKTGTRLAPAQPRKQKVSRR